MNLRSGSFKLSKIPRQKVFFTILLGLTGFLLNTVELQLGWGMQFIFGNALVFAFMRVLAPQMVILGISISSLWTIFLWHHPWAWIVWVCEAIFIAFFGRSRSLVRRDLIFWLVLGAPLLLLFYGLVMNLTEFSTILVVAKQATNGILNVVLGELLYVAIIGINPFRKFDRWPKLTTESVVLSVLTPIILIPITVYLAFDAPAREQAARDAVGTSLEYQLAVSNAALNSWVQSRSLVLRMHAADEFDKNGVPKQDLLDELAPDFEQIVIAGPGRTLNWSASPYRMAVETADRQSGPSNISAQRGVRLINVAPLRPGQSAQFKLLVPFYANDKVGVIEAKLRTGVLHNLVNSSTKYPASGIFLVSATQGVSPLTQVPSSWTEKVQLLSSTQRMEALGSPVLLSDIGDGIADMSDLRNAQIMRSTILAELPEWQVVGVVPLAPAPAVIRDRQIQLRQLLAIMFFV